ncbi:hypothetical protein T492DRAFT_839785 [Pavlovales sp. CCMP2436]|nr:hypothetical protein T492DRAFT_839785 [Pavlovales sp. CCMP2436]
MVRAEAIVVVRFDDRNRYGINGIPGSLLFSGGRKCVVRCKDKTIEAAGKRNRFAKVEFDDEDSPEGRLMELLGNVGDYAAELHAYQLHFVIKPCHYPQAASWALLPDDLPSEAGAGGAEARLDRTDLHVFSVDNESTRDIDDALSFEFDGAAGCTIGIHVADVASRIPCTSPLFAWARARASSAYHGGIGGESESGSVPMLPPALAHDELSLNQGERRNTLSLFLRVEGTRITSRSHARTVTINRDATTYAKFGAATAGPLARGRELLRALSGQSEAEELIAWSMIEYNSYFGDALACAAETALAAASAGLGRDAALAVGLLRAQPKEGVSASYVLAAQDGQAVSAVHPPPPPLPPPTSI